MMLGGSNACTHARFESQQMSKKVRANIRRIKKPKQQASSAIDSSTELFVKIMVDELKTFDFLV